MGSDPVTPVPPPADETRDRWPTIAADWPHFRRRFSERWGRLTEADLSLIAGREEQLLGVIQQRYGIARGFAEQQVCDFLRRLFPPPSECKRCGSVEVCPACRGSSSLASSAPEEDRERFETMMSALDALAEGPLPGLAVDNIARYAAQRIRADAARLAALREQLDEARRAQSDLDETMVALDHLLRSCRAAGFKGRDAVLMGRAVTRDMAALRTQAARDREALEELADHIRRRPPTFNDGTVVSRTWYLELERLAALRATEGGA